MSIRITPKLRVNADWWSKLSEKQQTLYLKQHPSSKKAKEVRQEQQGQQPRHAEESPKEHRMFGEHKEEHKEPPAEPKKVKPEKKVEPKQEVKPEADEPKKEVEPRQEIAPPKEAPKAEEPQPDPDQFVDEYSAQVEKGPTSKVAKEFLKQAKKAQGPDAEDFAQMEDIWNRTSSFEELGLEPTEFTKDSLIFRGKPKDHQSLMRDLNRLGKGNLKADDHGNLSGDLEINGKKVTVLMHRMGRGGETLVSIYPLLDKPEPSKKGAGQKPSLLGKIGHVLKHLAPVDREFFEKEEYRPRSKSRRTFAKFFKDKTKGIMRHLHHQGKEWHTAIKAVKKLAGKKELNEHDKEALQSVAKDIVYTLLSVAIAGGLGHGLLGLLHHVGTDIVRDSLLKAAAHSAIHASAQEGDDASDEDDDAFLQEVLKNVTDAIEGQDLPDEVWEKVATSAAPNGGIEDKPEPETATRRVDREKGRGTYHPA